MRIWVVHQHAIPPTKMGPTRHFELAKKLIAKGHEVFILAGNYCHNNFHYMSEPFTLTKKIMFYEGVPFIWLPVPAYKRNSVSRLWNMLVFARNLHLKLLKTLEKPDVIIGSSPSPFAAFSAERLARYYKIPFVYEIRDLWPETLLNIGSFSRLHPLIFVLTKIEKYLLNKSQYIISVLPGVKNYLIQKGISPQKFLWLPNFVDCANIPFTVAPTRAKKIITYAGSFNVANDLETLLSAAKIFQERNSHPFEIHLIGDGPEKQRLENIIRDKKLTCVKLISPLAKNDVYEKLLDSDIFVGMVKKSNLYQWGTSLNKVADYLACARPIVFATDSPYCPIREAKAGITIPPENPRLMAQALEQLIELSYSERESLGRNGRNYAATNFNLETISVQLEAKLLDLTS